MNPTVTIGIPCYNSARWLRESVRSALEQDWPAKEIIVVDDGSSDESVEILRAFGNQIELIQTPHRGSNYARNEVLRRAKGEWIQYLDADDLLLPKKISHQFSEVKNVESCDVIYSPVLVDESGKREPSRLDTSVDLYAQWIAWELPQTGGCLWRKQALEWLGGWNEAMPCCQEHELYLRAMKAGLAFCYAPSANAVYRIWSDTTLCRRDPRLVVKVKTGLIDELRAWMQSLGLWTSLHQEIAARACFEMSRTLARFDLAEARAYHRERKAAGLIQLDGPAAPRTYRLSYSILGFAGAEKLARALR
jgi:glycosyltransferase involved in cell wall biosynthesis